MNMKNILLFVGGLTVGGAAGVLGTRKYFRDFYQNRYEEDHAALEEYYQRTDEYARRKDQNDENDYEDDGINSPDEIDSRPGGRMTAEERAERKELLNRNWEGTTNYAGMYREKNGYTESKLAEGEHPLDQDEESEEAEIDEDEIDDEEFSEETPEESAFNDHQRNMNKPPKIISAEAYGDLPAHIEKEVLYYYKLDETLTDDNEDPVDEPERLIGDALHKYGFAENDEQIIFVMNYAMDVCYEIQKFDGSWIDTH